MLTFQHRNHFKLNVQQVMSNRLSRQQDLDSARECLFLACHVTDNALLPSSSLVAEKGDSMWLAGRLISNDSGVGVGVLATVNKVKAFQPLSTKLKICGIIVVFKRKLNTVKFSKAYGKSKHLGLN